MENIYDPLTQDLYGQLDQADEAAKEKESETIFTKKDDPRGKWSGKAANLAADLAGNRTTEKEPNWHQMLLRADNMAEKHRIRSMRDAWQDEQKHRAHQVQQAADQARVDAVKSVPLRNKAFYDQLMRTDGRVYWSTEVQRLMKADKHNQGLGWYSKK